MTKKEIIEAIENGGKLEVCHFIRHIQYSIILNDTSKRITEKQYNMAKQYFANRLQHDAIFGGLTRHFYFLKQQQNAAN